ncbi:MAG TPA: hypothetical protein VM574_04110, partial [Terrimicrobiaceae bacterium]|nr:hypothetical protein [Terrimicrobiaceae bacterium]
AIRTDRAKHRLTLRAHTAARTKREADDREAGASLEGFPLPGVTYAHSGIFSHSSKPNLEVGFLRPDAAQEPF